MTTASVRHPEGMVAVRPEKVSPPVLELVPHPEALPDPEPRVRRAVRRDPALRDPATPAARDAMTAQWLRSADGADVDDLEVLDYTPEWWDGAVFVPCLLVRWRRTSWRLVVFDGDRAVALPRGSRRARTVLAGYRAALADPAFAVPLAGLASLLSRRPVLSLPGADRDTVEIVGASEPRVARVLAAQARHRSAAAERWERDPDQPTLFGIDLLHRAAAEPDLARPRGRHRAQRRVSVVAVGDSVICSNNSCGGLLLIPAPGHGAVDEFCPRCGRR